MNLDRLAAEATAQFHARRLDGERRIQARPTAVRVLKADRTESTFALSDFSCADDVLTVYSLYDELTIRTFAPGTWVQADLLLDEQVVVSYRPHEFDESDLALGGI